MKDLGKKIEVMSVVANIYILYVAKILVILTIGMGWTVLAAMEPVFHIWDMEDIWLEGAEKVLFVKQFVYQYGPLEFSVFSVAVILAEWERNC